MVLQGDIFEGFLCFLDDTDQILPPHAPNYASLSRYHTTCADGVPVAVTTALPYSWLVQPAKQDHKAFQDCPCPESEWIGVSAAPQTPVLENT